MHELSYCEGVLEAVERRAGGRPVAAIGVRIGAVHRIDPASFQQSFQLLAAGGPAAGATTTVVDIPGDEVVLEWLRYAGNAPEGADEAVPPHTHVGEA